MISSPYTLSFTVGGLFLFEGIALAKLRAAGSSWDEVRHAVPAGVFVAQGGASSVKRIRNEVVGRLARLTDPEITHLASTGMTDARALMWVAACRKYRILAEFAREVLDERLRTFQPEIRVTDFDALLDAKGVHAEEIARLTPSTRARLRSGAFRMLREAELLDAQNRVCAPRLSGSLHDLLASDRRSGLDLIPGGG
jgi:membrane-bound lytic murein transglycosylase B